MKKSNLTGLLIGLVVFGMVSSVSAATTTLIDKGDNWSYLQVDDNTTYGGINWTNSDNWTTGNAAFGNDTGHGGYTHLSHNTSWDANTNLALSKTFTVSGSLDSASLNVASDNGFEIYLNGNLILSDFQEGYTSYWEYANMTFDSSFFKSGENILTVLAKDTGGATFFDMQLTANVNPVPVPAAVWLLGSGLAGLVTVRRKIAKK